MLPPSLPTPPGQAGPPVNPQRDTLMIGVADLGQVWLLDETGYTQLTSQDDVNALGAAGIAGVAVSTGTHHSLYLAGQATLSIDLGSELLAGLLKVTRGK